MTIPTISTLPTAPARTDAPATFISRADAFLAALVTMQSELNTSIGAMNTDIGGIAANVTAAQAAQTAAELAETNAEAAQAAAEAASNATLWVSGTSYSAGDVVYSPVDYKSYRANTATSGTTDPSASADWTKLTYALPSQTGNAGFYLTTDGTNESWAAVATGGVELTASGSITAGNGVLLNADGTGSAVTGAPATLGTDNNIGTTAYEETCVVYCAASDKSLAVYRNSSGGLFAVVISVDGSYNITFGTPTYISDGSYPALTYMSDSGNVLISWQFGSSIYGAVASISGTSVTIGSSSSYAPPFLVTTRSHPGYNPSTQQAVYPCLDYNNGNVTGTIFSISGTTVTIGTAQTITSFGSNSDTEIAYNSTDDNWAVRYSSGSNYTSVAAFTISGSTITGGTGFTAISIATTSNVNDRRLVYNSSENHYVVSGTSGSNTYIRPFSVSGTTITGIAPYSRSYDGNWKFVLYDSVNDYLVYGNRIYVWQGIWGGTVYSSPTLYDITLNYNPNQSYRISYSLKPGAYVISVGRDSSNNGMRAQVANFLSTNMSNGVADFIGVATSSCADGETFTFETVGGSTGPVLSGLTIGSTAYMCYDGVVRNSKLSPSGTNSYQAKLGITTAADTVLMASFST